MHNLIYAYACMHSCFKMCGGDMRKFHILNKKISKTEFFLDFWSFIYLKKTHLTSIHLSSASGTPEVT